MLSNIKPKFIYYLAVSVIVLSTLSSCGIGLIVRGAAKKSMSVEKGTVPPDFIQKNQTLIVLLWGDKSFDKYAKKAFNKFYTGKKKFVTFSELKNDEEYQDVDKYPFVYSQGPGDLAMYEGNSYSYTFSGSRPFHIFDRRNKTFYKPNFRSGLFSRVMQGHAKALNAYVE
jgi:hypothetical protein